MYECLDPRRFLSIHVESDEMMSKETVSRDGRVFKSGINQKVSLNPIIPKAKNVILLKGQFKIYI